MDVDFRGHTYLGYRPAILPVEGESLGTGTLPSCDDSNEGRTRPPLEIEIAELPGVSPDIAVLWADHETILVRADVDPLPPKIARLMKPPDCLSKDVPIELLGLWRGILGADGKTELDLVPPYDVELFVARASASRYERASLSVRVPPDLGTPISQGDITSSLREGGMITIVAECDGTGFRARAVDALPG